MRQARFHCECGAKPRDNEVDFHVQHRQKAIAAALRVADQSTERIAPTLDELWDEDAIPSLIGRIYAAGDAVGREQTRGEPLLAQVMIEVEELSRWAQSLRPLRPLVAVHRETQVVATAMNNLLAAMVVCLGSDRMADAQNTGTAAQLHIDRAAEAVSRAEALRSKVEEVLSSDDPIGTWLGVAIGGDFGDAAARGEALLAGVGWVGGSSASLASVVHNELVGTIGDPDVFWAAVGLHADFLRSLGPSLRPTYETPEFFSRAADVTHDLWAAARIALALPDPETPREEATRLLDQGHLVVEQALKFHLGVAASATSKRDFDATQACDVSELVNVALDQAWPIATLLPGADIRNSFGHRDYEVLNDLVILAVRGRAKRGLEQHAFTVPELQDSVLSLLELAAAMDLALLLVAGDSGYGSRLKFEDSMIRSLLVAFGWRRVRVFAPNESLYRIQADVWGAQRMGCLALVSRLLDARFDQVELELTRVDTETSVELKFPAAEFSRIAADISGEGVAAEIGLFRVLHMVKRNGMPMLDAQATAVPIAIQVFKIMVDRQVPFSEVNAELKLWRQLARDLDLPEVVRDIGRSQRFRAMGEAGDPVSEEEVAGLFSFATGLEPPDLSDVLI